MISFQILDAGQALTVQSFQRQHLRTQALVNPSVQTQSQPLANTAQKAPEVQTMASLEKLHTQKKTAQSAIGALQQIKKSLLETQGQLVHSQTSSKPLSEQSYFEDQRNAMLNVQEDLNALRDQVQSDANEKAIFQALEAVVNEGVDFYQAIEDGELNFSQAMDRVKQLNLSALSSQAKIEKIQGQLEASTFQVVQLASSYEAGLFNPSSPFEVAEDLYGLSFQNVNQLNSVLPVGGVLDQVS